jgi:isoquinoline 1-oxidoreductase beta subunit
MVYGTALHSPAAGNHPESWNEVQVNAMPGVLATIKLKDGIGIVAHSFEQAMAGRRALKVSWSQGKTSTYDSDKALASYEKIHADPNYPTKEVVKTGAGLSSFSWASKTYHAEFRSDYSYHAQMEPLNATARFNEAGDKVEVWDGSQDLGRSRDYIAKALGFKPEQVDVHQCYIGGGFGRRSLADYAAEAALLARAVKRPVKLVWTREEDIAHGMSRPQAFQCVEAATDLVGKVIGWHHCVVGDDGHAALLTGGMKISPYYAISNQSIELRNVDHGIRIKHWRAVAHNFNLFAIEGLVDEIATDQKLDPIEFRFRHMSVTPKARRVIEAVAKMSDWKANRPDGRALGFAMTERSGSLGAGVVEVSLNRSTGRLRVHKVWIAVDGGTIVQPEAARENVESGIIYGLSNVLNERVSMSNGAVEQSNFNDYTVMRMSDVPEELHVEFLESDGQPTGVGEIGTPFMMPAIANAFHKLSGKRLYHMPFTPERVLAALKA